jgi:hypothetical protein
MPDRDRASSCRSPSLGRRPWHIWVSFVDAESGDQHFRDMPSGLAFEARRCDAANRGVVWRTVSGTEMGKL